MGLGKKLIITTAVIAALGATTAVAWKITGNFPSYQQSYWVSEVAEEKDTRLYALEEAERISKNSNYTPQDMQKMAECFVYASNLFNTMDLHKGDIPAYDVPLSPGDKLIGMMNMRYAGLLDQRGLITDLAGQAALQKTISVNETDLDERVSTAVTNLKTVLTDPKLNQKDVADARFSNNFYHGLLSGVCGVVATFLLSIGPLAFYEIRRQKKSPAESCLPESPPVV
jgi:hypothetical protein